MIRTVIVDDERLVRAELRRLLAAHPDVEIVVEAAAAAQARDLIEQHRPDLLLLDVQIPGGSGFDLLSAPAMTAALEIGKGVSVQIEVENLAELNDALAAGATSILLDNFTLDAMREAVAITNGRAVLEASGGINNDTVHAIAETGVDRISIGSLTKDIRATDYSLRVL